MWAPEEADRSHRYASSRRRIEEGKRERERERSKADPAGGMGASSRTCMYVCVPCRSMSVGVAGRDPTRRDRRGSRDGHLRGAVRARAWPAMDPWMDGCSAVPM